MVMPKPTLWQLFCSMLAALCQLVTASDVLQLSDEQLRPVANELQTLSYRKDYTPPN